MEPYLSQREFDTWRDAHDQKIDLIIHHFETQTERNLKTESRISRIETLQKEQADTIVRRTTWLTTFVGVVASLFTAGLAWLLQKHG